MSIYKPKAYWPLIITSANQSIRVLTAADHIATIATGTYYTPESLAAAVQTALAVYMTGSPAVTVAVSSLGYFSVTWNSAFTLKFLTTPDAAALLGFSEINLGATSSGGSFVATAQHQHSNGWYSPTAVLRDTRPIRDKIMDVVTRNMNGATKYLSEAELVEREVTFAYLPAEKTYEADAGTTYLNQAIETWWDDGRARFRYWEDAATLLSPVDYVLADTTFKTFAPQRMHETKGIYELKLKFWGYVS